MKKTLLIGLAAVFGLFSTVAFGEGKIDEQAKKVQERCPVMGGKINKDLYVDHDGKRIYVCCKGCISKIKENPELYIKKFEKRGITLDQVPEAAKKSGKTNDHSKHNH